jgi:hypothetical protein
VATDRTLRNTPSALFASLRLLAVLSIIFSAAALLGPAVVLADGADSPPECTALAGNEDGGDGDEVTVSAEEEGDVITAICIKSGKDAIEGEKHSGLITEDGTVDGCYEVEGLGTDEVTVTRVDDEDCKEISHVDFGAAAPTPTPTPSPTPSPTPTGGEQGGTPTPTPTATATATPGGGVAGGNPTPTPAPVPNTAMTVQGSTAALALAAILIGSLLAMAYVRLARQPR